MLEAYKGTVNMWESNKRKQGSWGDRRFCNFHFTPISRIWARVYYFWTGQLSVVQPTFMVQLSLGNWNINAFSMGWRIDLALVMIMWQSSQTVIGHISNIWKEIKLLFFFLIIKIGSYDKQWPHIWFFVPDKTRTMVRL